MCDRNGESMQKKKNYDLTQISARGTADDRVAAAGSHAQEETDQ